MSTLTKFLIVLNSVLSIALSVFFITGAARWEKGQRLAEELLQQRNAALAERQQVETLMTIAIAQKDKEVQDAIEARDTARKDATQVSQTLKDSQVKLGEASNRAEFAEAGRKKLEEILQVQTTQLTALEKQNQTLLSEHIDLQTRNQQLASRNYELTSELTIRDDELRSLRERLGGREGLTSADLQAGLPSEDRFAGAGAETPPNVSTLTGLTVTPNMRGEVVDVAGNYASVNVGESSGVAKGMVAMVFRGQQYLADLTIDTVRPREAGGKLTTRVGDVRSGDRVQFIRR